MSVCCQPRVGLKMTSRDQLSQWDDMRMPKPSATISATTFASYSPDQKESVWSVMLGVVVGDMVIWQIPCGLLLPVCRSTHH